MHADSIGSYFSRVIKAHPETYPCEQIIEPEGETPAAPPEQAERIDAPLPGQRITRLTVGRTYNLGNYESLRIELSWDLAGQDSPANVYRALRSQLDQLRAMRLQGAIVSDDDPDRSF
jgi:hypothetical protein